MILLKNDLLLAIQFSAIVLLLSISGCRAKNNTTAMTSIVSTCGTYSLAKSDARLVVEDRNGLLAYRVESKKGGGNLISELGEASINQRWFFYWDSNLKELWFHSSDLGLFLWLLNNDTANYERFSVTPGGTYSKRIPQPALQQLPNSIKTLFDQASPGATGEDW